MTVIEPASPRGALGPGQGCRPRPAAPAVPTFSGAAAGSPAAAARRLRRRPGAPPRAAHRCLRYSSTTTSYCPVTGIVAGTMPANRPALVYGSPTSMRTHTTKIAPGRNVATPDPPDGAAARPAAPRPPVRTRPGGRRPRPGRPARSRAADLGPRERLRACSRRWRTTGPPPAPPASPRTLIAGSGRWSAQGRSPGSAPAPTTRRTRRRPRRCRCAAPPARRRQRRPRAAAPPASRRMSAHGEPPGSGSFSACPRTCRLTLPRCSTEQGDVSLAVHRDERPVAPNHGRAPGRRRLPKASGC